MGGTLVGGICADRLGRRPVLLTSHFASAVCTIMLGLSTSDALLLGSALLVGFFAGASRPATSAMIADVLPPEDRVRAFSLNYWAMNLGFATSVIFAGLAAEAGFRLLFFADAGATFLCWLVLLVAVPEPQRAPRPAKDAAAPPVPGLRRIMADRRFASCVVLFILMAAVLQQMTVTLPIDMSGAGLSQTACGAVIALNGVVICLFQVPAGGLLPRCPPFTMLSLAAALIGIGFGLTAFADSTLAFAVTVVIWTAGEVISGPVSMEVTARFATATSQGRYQGVGAFAWTVGGTIASAVGGSNAQDLIAVHGGG